MLFHCSYIIPPFGCFRKGAAISFIIKNEKPLFSAAPGKMKVDTEKVPTFIFCCRIVAKGERAWERKEHHIGDTARKRNSES